MEAIFGAAVGGLLVLGAVWLVSYILGLRQPTPEELNAMVREAIAEPFEELDEFFGISEANAAEEEE